MPPRHWIFLINLPVGIIGAIATLTLMPNYKMQTRRFDFFGFILLAAGMATLTLALDGQKGLGISSLSLALLVALGVTAILWYLWHARGNANALFSLNLFKNPTYRLGLFGSFAGRIGSGMLPFMTPVFFTDWDGLLAVPCRADDDPDGTWQHGDEAYCGAGGEPLWLSPRAGGRHDRAGVGLPAVYGRGAAGLVLHPAAGAVLPGGSSTPCASRR